MTPTLDAGFADAMRRFEPFEPAPLLAVAVSGGSDSLALLLLADRWARLRGGSVLALTVDHGLRRDAAAEARAVAGRCAGLGIAHRILAWPAPHLGSGVQAAARAARYDLLAAACRDAGILHLLTAHQCHDQAETLLLRLADGSGPVGLAAMSACVETGFGRILRPLLGIGRDRLRAALQASGEAWSDDPSNRDTAFARVRLRALAPHLETVGLDAARLAAVAGGLGRARIETERALDRLLAGAVALDPAGFARLDAAALADAPRDLGLRALAAVLGAVSGSSYPPRRAGLDGLWQALLQPAGRSPGRTLGGCRIVQAGGRWLVLREAAAVAAPVMLGARPVLWDGRFVASAQVPAELGPLGAAGVVAVRRAGAANPAVPRRVWPVLPAVRLDGRLLAVPHLGWCDPVAASGAGGGFGVRFRPRRALSGGGFTVA